jgi:hypothetical protein
MVKACSLQHPQVVVGFLNGSLGKVYYIFHSVALSGQANTLEK